MTDIFVFGSNQAGRHGKGSALEALRKHGAIYGQGEGRQGNSYGIPTKDWNLRQLPLAAIEGGIKTFIRHAEQHPKDKFHVVAIGCGLRLAGYTPKQIAPMFKGVPRNVLLPTEFGIYMCD